MAGKPDGTRVGHPTRVRRHACGSAFLLRTAGAMHGLTERVSALTTNFATASKDAKRYRDFAAMCQQDKLNQSKPYSARASATKSR
jgi:hypothetical protein